MQAVADNGGAGWMIWNAAAFFSEGALGPPVAGEDAADVTAADPELGPSVAPSVLPSALPSGSP
jgi:hypothetical protein